MGGDRKKERRTVFVAAAEEEAVRLAQEDQEDENNDFAALAEVPTERMGLATRDLGSAAQLEERKCRLNDEQRVVFDKVVKACHDLHLYRTGQCPDFQPLRLFVSGVGGWSLFRFLFPCSSTISSIRTYVRDFVRHYLCHYRNGQVVSTGDDYGSVAARLQVAG